MVLYVVERYAPRAPRGDVAGADRLAVGPTIRHLRTWYLPSDETCFALFDAPSAEALRAAGDAAGVSYTRITEAIETSGSAP